MNNDHESSQPRVAARPAGNGLEALFRPRSIAIVGASADPEKISGMPVHFLRTLDYAGEVYPVNPRGGHIQGYAAHTSLEAIGRPVDLAICALPARLVRETVIAAVAAGVRSMIVFASGFAEMGEEGARQQDEIVSLARAAGMRLLGPNCLGMINVAARVPATFSPALLTGLPRAGGIAVVSQSGAFGMFAFVRAREGGLGLSYFVATGNEGDVELADCIDYLVDDDAVSVILCYIEGVRDGARLVAAFEKARERRKPIAVCKVGRSEAGARAASSHTAALAGSDAVYDALFRQYGVHRAANIEELFDVGYAFDTSPAMASDRLGIVTISGGAGVLMADAAAHYGLDVAPMPEAARARVLERVPFASAANPVDITAHVLNDLELLGDTLEWMAGAGYAGIASFQTLTGITPQHRWLVTDVWADFRSRHPDIAAAVVTVFDAETRRALDEHRCLAFEEPERAVRALAALARYRAHLDRSDGLPPGLDRIQREDPRDGAARSTSASAGVPFGPGADEVAALEWLGGAGIEVIDCARAATPDEAVAAARRLGYPVVVKVLSPDIAHKSDVGGVALGLENDTAVREAFEQVRAGARAAHAGARVDEVVVAPMLADGLECIAGVVKDPVFGPLVMVGLGGVLVEVLEDVSFRRAPFGVDEALRMLGELRAARVFEGVRGRAPRDVAALAALLAKLSVLAVTERANYASIDLNPVLVFARGRGVCAVDALIVPESTRVEEAP